MCRFHPTNNKLSPHAVAEGMLTQQIDSFTEQLHISGHAAPAGLPTLKAAAGFRFYDEFEDEFYFEYPKVSHAWLPPSLHEPCHHK
jgi:hypothetical protein